MVHIRCSAYNIRIVAVHERAAIVDKTFDAIYTPTIITDHSPYI